MDKDGSVTAKVDAADLNTIVEKAEKEGTGTILIVPTGTEKVKKVTMELPRSAAANVAATATSASSSRRAWVSWSSPTRR